MIILKVRKELDSEGKRKQKFKGFLLENSICLLQCMKIWWASTPKLVATLNIDPRFVPHR